MTPCMAVYGKAASIGLASSSLPQELYTGVGIVEDDLEAMYTETPFPGQDIATENDTISSQHISHDEDTTPDQITDTVQNPPVF